MDEPIVTLSRMGRVKLTRAQPLKGKEDLKHAVLLGGSKGPGFERSSTGKKRPSLTQLRTDMHDPGCTRSKTDSKFAYSNLAKPTKNIEGPGRTKLRTDSVDSRLEKPRASSMKPQQAELWSNKDKPECVVSSADSENKKPSLDKPN